MIRICESIYPRLPVCPQRGAATGLSTNCAPGSSDIKAFETIVPRSGLSSVPTLVTALASPVGAATPAP